MKFFVAILFAYAFGIVTHMQIVEERDHRAAMREATKPVRIQLPHSVFARDQ